MLKIADITVAESDSANVQKFEEKFSLRFLCDYILWSVWNTAYKNETLVSNSPISLGLGFAYDELFKLFKIWMSYYCGFWENSEKDGKTVRQFAELFLKCMFRRFGC